MHEERIERALRVGPPDEPVYEPSLVATGWPVSGWVVRPLRRRSSRLTLTGWLRVGATAAAALAVVAGGLILRSEGTRNDQGARSRPDLLQRVRAAGIVRVAVPAGPPQVAIGDAYDGFDVEVAHEIARRLGVRVEIVMVDRDRLALGGWDVAVGLPIETAGPIASYSFTGPYAYWPAIVVVLRESKLRSVSDLAGSPICIPYGSPAESWLAGSLDVDSPTSPLEAPHPGSIYKWPFWYCENLLRHPAVDAIVSDRLTPDQLASKQGLRRLGEPVFTEPIGIAVPGDGASAQSLVAELDQTLNAMRADGALAGLSRRTLSGADITQTPIP
jgi:polar amino acid transport system substrate-binding protein